MFTWKSSTSHDPGLKIGLEFRGGSHVFVLVLVHSTVLQHFIYALKTSNLVVMEQYCIQHFSNLKIHDDKNQGSGTGARF